MTWISRKWDICIFCFKTSQTYRSRGIKINKKVTANFYFTILTLYLTIRRNRRKFWIVRYKSQQLQEERSHACFPPWNKRKGKTKFYLTHLTYFYIRKVQIVRYVLNHGKKSKLQEVILIFLFFLFRGFNTDGLFWLILPGLVDVLFFLFSFFLKGWGSNWHVSFDQIWEDQFTLGSLPAAFFHQQREMKGGLFFTAAGFVGL